MKFPANVERWRRMVREEVSGTNVPENLVLATILNESVGIPGLVGVSGDLGLTQIKITGEHSTLADVRRRHPEVTEAALRGVTDEDVRLQIRAGVDVWSVCLGRVDAIAPGLPPAERILQADLCYSAGTGAWQKQRSLAATPKRFEQLENVHGGPIPGRKFGHARRVLAASGGTLPALTDEGWTALEILALVLLLAGLATWMVVN